MNDSLRQALFAARMTEEDLAARLEVDPKTVRRWLSGRMPYARHRQALANLLEVEESLLWPRGSSRSLDPELVAVYPHGLELSAWFSFFGSAASEVDILYRPDAGAGSLDLARALEQTPPSIRRRTLVVGSAIAQLTSGPEHQLRSTNTDFPHDIFRADNELLVLQHAINRPGSSGPIIHIVDVAKPDGLFAIYRAAFESAWQVAAQAVS